MQNSGTSCRGNGESRFCSPDERSDIRVRSRYRSAHAGYDIIVRDKRCLKIESVCRRALRTYFAGFSGGRALPQGSYFSFGSGMRLSASL
jgi:hypothetical protein